MKIITKEEFLENETFYLEEILAGKIFIYPTDTIYGIGCDAQNAEAIMKIREIKNRDKKPISIIAPSKKWIADNCEVEHERDLDRLPGPYTFILKLHDREAVARKELIGDSENIAVRIPNNWFSDWIGESFTPFLTTSVNIAGEPHLTNPDELKKEIEEKVDYLIDDGIIDGKPSKIINLTKNKEIVRN